MGQCCSSNFKNDKQLKSIIKLSEINLEQNPLINTETLEIKKEDKFSKKAKNNAKNSINSVLKESIFSSKARTRIALSSSQNAYFQEKNILSEIRFEENANIPIETENGTNVFKIRTFNPDPNVAKSLIERKLNKRLPPKSLFSLNEGLKFQSDAGITDECDEIDCEEKNEGDILINKTLSLGIPKLKHYLDNNNSSKKKNEKVNEIQNINLQKNDKGNIIKSKNFSSSRKENFYKF